MRIPTKPAMHSNLKPATCSDPKPAEVPDLMSATLRRAAAGRWDDVFLWLLGQADGSGMRRLRMLSPASSIL
jgi:hypothetical protein